VRLPWQGALQRLEKTKFPLYKNKKRTKKSGIIAEQAGLYLALMIHDVYGAWGATARIVLIQLPRDIFGIKKIFEFCFRNFP